MAVRRRRFAPHGPVRSEPLPSREATRGDEEAPTTHATGGAWAVGVALVVFGAIGWLSGARYTLLGWVTGLNLFFVWLGLPITIPMPQGWWVLVMVPIGVVYSLVEMQVWKAHKRHGQALALFIMGWILVVATDVGSTYLGVRTPPNDAWPITLTVAASTGLAFVWAAILTFVSDWLILGGIKLLSR